jgi:hypothetical protein
MSTTRCMCVCMLELGMLQRGDGVVHVSCAFVKEGGWAQGSVVGRGRDHVDLAGLVCDVGEKKQIADRFARIGRLENKSKKVTENYMRKANDV